MAKERDRRDDDETEGEEQSAKKKLNLKPIPILVGVLFFLTLLQGGALGYLLLADPRSKAEVELSNQLAEQERRINQFSSDLESTALIARRAKILEERFDKTLEETDFNNFREIRSLMIEQELSYQRFLVTLQQGMYELSRMVKGSRTWYDVYKDELDKVIDHSRARTQELKSLRPRN